MKRKDDMPVMRRYREGALSAERTPTNPPATTRLVPLGDLGHPRCDCIYSGQWCAVCDPGRNTKRNEDDPMAVQRWTITKGRDQGGGTRVESVDGPETSAVEVVLAAELHSLAQALRQAATDLGCCVTAFLKAQTDPPALAVPLHVRERDAKAAHRRAMDALQRFDAP